MPVIHFGLARGSPSPAVMPMLVEFVLDPELLHSPEAIRSAVPARCVLGAARNYAARSRRGVFDDER